MKDDSRMMKAAAGAMLQSGVALAEVFLDTKLEEYEAEMPTLMEWVRLNTNFIKTKGAKLLNEVWEKWERGQPDKNKP